jgi:hypothetical protein
VATYRVHIVQTVSTSIEVETDEERPTSGRLEELAWESDDWPGPIAIGAFGRISVDEDGEWHAVEITGPDGETYWDGDDAR